jgi:hypothetical protein
MKRLPMMLCGLLVSGLAAAPMAQAPNATNQGTPKPKPDEAVVTGCVAAAPEAGHFILNNAELKGIVKPAENMMPSGPPRKASDTPTSYQLTGGELQAHVGHKVEITGAMEKAKPTEAGGAVVGTSGTGTPTLKVTAVKMIASTCP